MNKEEAKARIEAAEKELAAAKAALEQAQETDGRVIMKPSEVPVGEYFRFVDEAYSGAATHLKLPQGRYLSKLRLLFTTGAHDHKPVYLTDPYGNAIEPCEKLPYGFNVGACYGSISNNTRELSSAFDFSDTKDGYRYWEKECLRKKISSHAAAKLRGMIHKWNKENGGHG